MKIVGEETVLIIEHDGHTFQRWESDGEVQWLLEHGDDYQEVETAGYTDAALEDVYLRTFV